MTKSVYYSKAGELNRELKASIPRPLLKKLHERQEWRHFAIAFRQLVLLAGLPVIIYHFSSPLIWVPAAVLQGFVVFSFTILLHEAVHRAIFKKGRIRTNDMLAQFYGTLCGLAYSQYRRWHLDHHNQLGSAKLDPKRAHLTPKINARWYKLLYATPALYPIYFRAAAAAKKTYPAALQRKIKKERMISIGFHLGMLTFFAWLDAGFAIKAYVIPLFFVFPVAFTLNRLGQHYVIDPDNVAKWSTLMRPNPVWNFLFLYSSYHLEHHYFPAVPFYKLKKLQASLEPFFKRHGIEAVSYTRLLKLWFIGNHKPHSLPRQEKAAAAVGLARGKLHQ